MKAKLSLIFFWVFSVVFFTIAGAWLLSHAMGYNINWQYLSFEKTGILKLSFSPSDATVYLDGKAVKLDRRGSIDFLSPKRYDIEIRKEGYNPWYKTVEIRSGYVSKVENIVLFYSIPIQAKVSNKEIAMLDASVSSSNDLLFNEQNEIILLDNNEKKLVTRLSEVAQKVKWYPDKNHITYLASDGLWIIRKDGSDSYLILPLDSKLKISNYLFLGNGEKLIYKVGDEYKKAVMR